MNWIKRPTNVKFTLNSATTNSKKITAYYIGYLNIHGTHVTAHNSTNNNIVFFFVSDLKIVYYNNY